MGGLLRLMIALYVLGLIAYLILRAVSGDAFWWLALINNAVPYLFLPILLFLPIALLLRARSLAAYLTILGVISFGWVGWRVYLPKTPPPPAGIPVTLTTFNIFPQNERVEQAIDYLLTDQSDILLLQEMSATTADDLTRLNDAYPHSATDFIANGHAIYSRYPIRTAEEVTLGEFPAVRVELTINGERVVLYNVHLLMPVGDTPHVDLPLIPDMLLSYDETRRNQQISDLLALIAEETAPVIVAGDFNMVEFSPIYDTLSATLTDSYRAVTSDYGQTWADQASEEVPAFFPTIFRLDYVWHSPAINTITANVGVGLGSDHLPVHVTLDVPAR